MDTCSPDPLVTSDLIFVGVDYAWGLGGLLLVLLLIRFGKLERWVFGAFVMGWAITSSFELLQQVLSFTYPAKCGIETLEPKYIMWIFHAAGDSVLLLLFLGICFLIWGRRILTKFHWPTAILMGIFGMTQEFIVETTQRVWVYSDIPLNPVWATWNGREMTVQQWHWLILPVIYYALVRFWIYPKFGPKDDEGQPEADPGSVKKPTD